MEKKRVLIVDDEKDFTDMVKLNLEVTGKYMVKTESGGANALASAKEFKPDFILLDIVMPDMDGGAVLSQLKKDNQTRNIPVVFLTAIVTKTEVESKDNVIGGLPFLAKPVSIATIINSIEKYTGKIK